MILCFDEIYKVEIQKENIVLSHLQSDYVANSDGIKISDCDSGYITSHNRAPDMVKLFFT